MFFMTIVYLAIFLAIDKGTFSVITKYKKTKTIFYLILMIEKNTFILFFKFTIVPLLGRGLPIYDYPPYNVIFIII